MVQQKIGRTDGRAVEVGCDSAISRLHYHGWNPGLPTSTSVGREHKH